MAWTYTSPEASDRDAVRFLVGDTDPDDKLVTDEEIDFVLDTTSSEYGAAAKVLDVLATKFAREVSHSADGISYSGNQLSQQFADRAESMRKMERRLRGRRARPYAGGISWAERHKDDQDNDLIQTAFRSHQHDNPEKGRVSHDELRPRQ